MQLFRIFMAVASIGALAIFCGVHAAVIGITAVYATSTFLLESQ
jgi:hypothetical protein